MIISYLEFFKEYKEKQNSNYLKGLRYLFFPRMELH